MNHRIDVGYLPNRGTKVVPLDDKINLDRALWLDGYMEEDSGVRVPLPYRHPRNSRNDVLLSIDKAKRELKVTAGNNRSHWIAEVRIVCRD